MAFQYEKAYKMIKKSFLQCNDRTRSNSFELKEILVGHKEDFFYGEALEHVVQRSCGYTLLGVFTVRLDGALSNPI